MDSIVARVEALAKVAKPTPLGEPRIAKPVLEGIIPEDPNPSESGANMSVAYLSCPYFDPDPLVKETRHAIVNRVAFDLLRQGTMVYSPLTHNLPIDRLGIHGDWVAWKNFDHAMLSRCDRLIVLKLTGWEKSKGVAAEIACAEKLEKPIEWMEIHEEMYQSVSRIASSPYKEILSRLQVVNSEREWDQFHSPKNLAMSLTTETGELVEHFRWVTESQSFTPSPEKLSKIRDEIGDVFLNLLHLAEVLGIDLNQAAQHKLSEICKKYPVEQSKGRSDKYTEFDVS
ncbi:MAG: DUF1937 family protein [Verrucomicrobia bacterium]|nr:DUF1937 family protein [Verrucomicrobiota bacterium]